MTDELITVDLSYKELLKELSAFDKEMPNVARKLMRAVNNEVKKQIRRTAKSRGYSADKIYEGKTGTFNTGYRKNLKSYADKDFKAKIMFTKNAYYYKWIEYGARVPERKAKIGNKIVTFKGFNLPAKPLLVPIAQSIWGTNKASAIMEKQFQKEIDKQFKQ